MSDDLDVQPEQIAPIPRISMQAFCETPEVAQIVQSAIGDRRMERAHVKLHMGGAAAAIEAYRSAPTPNVIFLETTAKREELVDYLNALAEFCDAGTKVLVSGRMNDIVLYRELMSRGVSEYLVAPFTVLDFIRTVSRLYSGAGAEPVGKIVAFVGAKGGVGASTLAHNVAWSIPRDFDIQTALVDLDLGFGTAGLDFNQDPPQGIAEAVFAPDRVDSNLIDRLLSRCGDKLGLLAAPATLDRIYDFPETAFDAIIDILRASTPCVILDIPHGWTAWMRRVIVGADEIVLVAAPDLANLRNAKSLLDTIRAARPNDAKPKLILNFVGVPKRPEIAASDFAKAVDLDPMGLIGFEPKLFGTAANNGQMIAEVEPASKINETILELARAVTGRAEIRKARKNLLEPFKLKLGLSRAS
ncbi:CtpF protein [uncultured Methylovirgula sp.]|uniref:AAA family ATPase n=1 Tax=uncultured Methylovirgula sp. TaxID=1285960 RepID=UPI002605272A|nr:CtpF protein [uncultured Methylovirgula sp.]